MPFWFIYFLKMDCTSNILDKNRGLRMRWECRERFSSHWLQMKPLVNDPGMHHGTCTAHVPQCMSGSLTRGGGEYVPGFPGGCATRNFTYLARDPCILNMGANSQWTWGYMCTNGYIQIFTWVRFLPIYISCGRNINPTDAFSRYTSTRMTPDV